MNKNISTFALTILLLASIACRAGSRPEPIPTAIGYIDADSFTENQPIEVEVTFPLPEHFNNLVETGYQAVNFQTTTSMEDVIAFYREVFSHAGYTERDVTTAITAETFNLVFDGHPSGKAIIVQGTDLGDGTVNVNIRLEHI